MASTVGEALAWRERRSVRRNSIHLSDHPSMHLADVYRACAGLGDKAWAVNEADTVMSSRNRQWWRTRSSRRSTLATRAMVCEARVLGAQRRRTELLRT